MGGKYFFGVRYDWIFQDFVDGPHHGEKNVGA